MRAETHPHDVGGVVLRVIGDQREEVLARAFNGESDLGGLPVGGEVGDQQVVACLG